MSWPVSLLAAGLVAHLDLHERVSDHTCWIRSEAAGAYIFEGPLGACLLFALGALVYAGLRLRSGTRASRQVRTLLCRRHSMYTLAFMALWLFPMVHYVVDDDDAYLWLTLADAISASGQAAIFAAIRLSEPGAWLLLLAQLRLTDCVPVCCLPAFTRRERGPMRRGRSRSKHTTAVARVLATAPAGRGLAFPTGARPSDSETASVASGGSGYTSIFEGDGSTVVSEVSGDSWAAYMAETPRGSAARPLAPPPAPPGGTYGAVGVGGGAPLPPLVPMVRGFRPPPAGAGEATPADDAAEAAGLMKFFFGARGRGQRPSDAASDVSSAAGGKEAGAGGEEAPSAPLLGAGPLAVPGGEAGVPAVSPPPGLRHGTGGMSGTSQRGMELNPLTLAGHDAAMGAPPAPAPAAAAAEGGGRRKGRHRRRRGGDGRRTLTGISASVLRSGSREAVGSDAINSIGAGWDVTAGLRAELGMCMLSGLCQALLHNEAVYRSQLRAEAARAVVQRAAGSGASSRSSSPSGGGGGAPLPVSLSTGDLGALGAGAGGSTSDGEGGRRPPRRLSVTPRGSAMRPAVGMIRGHDGATRGGGAAPGRGGSVPAARRAAEARLLDSFWTARSDVNDAMDSVLMFAAHMPVRPPLDEVGVVGDAFMAAGGAATRTPAAPPVVAADELVGVEEFAGLPRRAASVLLAAPSTVRRHVTMLSRFRVAGDTAEEAAAELAATAHTVAQRLQAEVDIWTGQGAVRGAPGELLRGFRPARPGSGVGGRLGGAQGVGGSLYAGARGDPEGGVMEVKLDSRSGRVPEGEAAVPAPAGGMWRAALHLLGGVAASAGDTAARAAAGDPAAVGAGERSGRFTWRGHPEGEIVEWDAAERSVVRAIVARRAEVRGTVTSHTHRRAPPGAALPDMPAVRRKPLAQTPAAGGSGGARSGSGDTPLLQSSLASRQAAGMQARALMRPHRASSAGPRRDTELLRSAVLRAAGAPPAAAPQPLDRVDSSGSFSSAAGSESSDAADAAWEGGAPAAVAPRRPSALGQAASAAGSRAADAFGLPAAGSRGSTRLPHAHLAAGPGAGDGGDLESHILAAAGVGDSSSEEEEEGEGAEEEGGGGGRAGHFGAALAQLHLPAPAVEEPLMSSMWGAPARGGEGGEGRLETFEIVSVADEAFAMLRRAAGLCTAHIVSMFDPHALRLGLLKAHFSDAGSSSFFCRSLDESLVVKTIDSGEVEVLLHLLPAYIAHLRGNPASLLCRFYGCFGLQMAGSNRVWFLLMGNVFPCTQLPPTAETYDLKGSTVGRKARLTKSLESRDARGRHRRHGVLFQDTDLRLRFPEGLPALSRATARSVGVQLARDARLLAAHGIMDYSLLLSVVPVGSPRSPASLAKRAVAFNDRHALSRAPDIDLPLPLLKRERISFAQGSRIVRGVARAARHTLWQAADLAAEEAARNAGTGPTRVALGADGALGEAGEAAGGTGAAAPGGRSQWDWSAHFAVTPWSPLALLQGTVPLGTGDDGEAAAVAAAAAAKGASAAAGLDAPLLAEDGLGEVGALPGLGGGACEEPAAGEGGDLAGGSAEELAQRQHVLLQLGVIDVLQTYDTGKRLEKGLKILRHANMNVDVSSLRPDAYLIRFITFMRSVLGGVQ